MVEMTQGLKHPYSSIFSTHAHAWKAAVAHFPLADPSGSSSIVAAVQWLEGTLLGTIATTIAVIAVASVGFLALSGRVDVRRALTVVAGCFVLFGATSIVAGLQSAIAGTGTAEITYLAPRAEVSPLTALPKTPANHDPYAGAAVPTR
jgi:type IV secretory pathway VirB2 component (pilin)